MFALYRQSNSDAEFKYLHVYKRIDKCEKWAEVRRTLDKAKETYKPDAPTPGASEGRPDGNKVAKKGKHADAATARVQESIEHCLADAQARAVLREEKTEARWSALMSSSAVKLDLLRTNVAAKKRNTDLAFLLGGADMLQSTDEAVKAWYLAERGLILNQLPSTRPPTPTPRIACTGGGRKHGNAIASQEEMRAFVTASARIIERNGPPVLPLGLF